MSESVALRGKGWTVYARPRKRWELRFYENGEQKKHRVPVQVNEAKLSKYVESFLAERLRRDIPAAPSPIRSDQTLDARVTVQQFGELWTDGILHRMFPNRIRWKKSAKSDASRFEVHVYPVIGHIQVRAFQGPQGVEWAEGVLRRIEKPGTARQVGQVISRLLTMAAFPGIRLIQHSPLPKGFVPPNPKRRAMSYLYPSEELLIMQNTLIDLKLRVYMGLSIREGGRLGNLLTLKLRQVDLDAGIIRLDETKTDEPISWVLDPGVTEALRRYKDLRGLKEADADFFLDGDGQFRVNGGVVHRTKMAGLVRDCLVASKVDRAELFEHTSYRMRFRAHDLRSSFVTVKLANGKSETWVMDRTGHTTSQMLNKYRRAARSHVEAQLGDFRPLHLAIPELRRPEDEPPDEPKEGES